MAEADNPAPTTDAAAPKAPKVPPADDTTGAAPKAAKKEKPPAVEDKPLADLIAQDYLPAVQQGLQSAGIEADLAFVKQMIPVRGYATSPECWQVVGKWQSAWGARQFNLYFFDENLQGQRGFSCTEGGIPSTMESFRIDERKLSLDLLVQGTLQRLDAQKWLALN
jgi:hypothetical protein